MFRRALSTVARNGHLITDWTAWCRCLGLDEFDVETIDYRYTGVRERCYIMYTAVGTEEEGGREGEKEDEIWSETLNNVMYTALGKEKEGKGEERDRTTNRRRGGGREKI